jgi:hypothetical protein
MAQLGGITVNQGCMTSKHKYTALSQDYNQGCVTSIPDSTANTLQVTPNQEEYTSQDHSMECMASIRVHQVLETGILSPYSPPLSMDMTAMY